MSLLEGKKVMGYKLNKNQKREMKFMIMNNVDEIELKKRLVSFLFEVKSVFRAK